MEKDPIFYEDVGVGTMLPELVKEPSYIQLFRYSAITWNAHRIHYDQKYAATEGYPDVLVQSHLHGAFLTQLCTDWVATEGSLKSLGLQVKRFSIPGDKLICKGRIVEKQEIDDEGLVTVEIEELNQRNEVCATGRAVIKLSKKIKA